MCEMFAVVTLLTFTTFLADLDLFKFICVFCNSYSKLSVINIILFGFRRDGTVSMVWSYANGDGGRRLIEPESLLQRTLSTAATPAATTWSFPNRPPEGIVSHGTVQFASQESQSTTEPCYPHLQAA